MTNFCEHFLYEILSKSGEKCRIYGQNYTFYGFHCTSFQRTPSFLTTVCKEHLY